MRSNLGINYVENDINIIDIAPVLIMNKKWYCVGFEAINSQMDDFFHLALIHNEAIPTDTPDLLSAITTYFSDQSPLLRVHSECILGDSFHSSLCDCGEQLHQSLQLINDEGLGIVLYLRQEGRGIGLRAKIACLALQEGYTKGKLTSEKHSPDEANLSLGFDLDEREYDIVPRILSVLQVKAVKLITGNPEKKKILENSDIAIKELISMKSSEKLNTRQKAELTEKIKRNYSYPELEKILNHEQ